MQTHNFLAILRGAARFALQWRLLLLWLAVLLIPTALAALPFWQVFATSLDHSVYAPQLAQRLDANSVADLVTVLQLNAIALKSAGIVSLVMSLLLSPFLSGMAITAAKASERLGFGALIHGGVAEYGRLLRLLLWGALPLGVAGGLGAGAMHLADKFAEKAILESNADLARHAALLLCVVLFLIADATLDAGRAQFALSVRRRSAIKAWWRGLKLIFKRPLASIGLYALLSVIGFVAAAALGVLRMNLPHASVLALPASLLLMQLSVAAIAWLRGARLFALVQLAGDASAPA
ncbi:MAG: hypothetical protein P4L91_12475 [Burkholderiaceae bacterium]|nr:hypothetical protein [Burkholderiaceae bacterium]